MNKKKKKRNRGGREEKGKEKKKKWVGMEGAKGHRQATQQRVRGEADQRANREKGDNESQLTATRRAGTKGATARLRGSEWSRRRPGGGK